VIGFFAGLILVVLVAVLIPLRFARALRRSLADPEFRGLFALVVDTPMPNVETPGQLGFSSPIHPQFIAV
jgi:hypothetical protein